MSDTGTGMTEEVRQRCVEPLFTTKNNGNTGMGLGIVYGIVQRHEGTIDIESEPGKGSNFAVLLPVQTPAERLPAPTSFRRGKRAAR